MFPQGNLLVDFYYFNGIQKIFIKLTSISLVTQVHNRLVSLPLSLLDSILSDTRNNLKVSIEYLES